MITKIGSPSVMVYSVKEVIETVGSTLHHTFTIPIYVVCKVTDSNDIDEYLGSIVEQLESGAYPDYTRNAEGYPAVTDGYIKDVWEIGIEGKTSGVIVGYLEIKGKYWNTSDNR